MPVRSHGTNSFQGWRKRIVVRSKFDPRVSILVSPKVIFADLLRKAFPQKHAFVDMNVFLSLRKQRPRFAQSQPKGYFQMKELDRTSEAIVPMNEMWRNPNANMRQYVPLCANVDPHCSLSAVHRNAACEEWS